MSMLSLVQNFCRRTNLPVPLSVSGSTDTAVIQVAALLEEEGSDLVNRIAWQAQTFEALHTSIAAEDQGAIATIAPRGFNYIKDSSIWNRTDNQRIQIITGDDWQDQKASASTGPTNQGRIRGGRLLVTPTLASGKILAFEYTSDFWILGSDGTTYKEFFTADTDTMLLPEKILLAGLRWRWHQAKNLEYAELFRKYEELVKNASARDGLKKTLSMNGERTSARPGLDAPPSNWPL